MINNWFTIQQNYKNDHRQKHNIRSQLQRYNDISLETDKLIHDK